MRRIVLPISFARRRCPAEIRGAPQCSLPPGAGAQRGSKSYASAEDISLRSARFSNKMKTLTEGCGLRGPRLQDASEVGIVFDFAPNARLHSAAGRFRSLFLGA